MLGVRLNPTMTPSDVHLKAAAERMGVGDSFHMAPVGVFFGDGEDADGATKAEPGDEVADPYFGGAGPARKACNECGECMTGCSTRREEHPQRELPVPRREGGRGRAPADHGRLGHGRLAGWLRDSHPADRRAPQSEGPDLHGPPGGPRGRRPTARRPCCTG